MQDAYGPQWPGSETSLLLDTTLFIDYHRGDQSATRFVDRIIAEGLVAYYSPVTLLEIAMDRRTTLVERESYQELLSLLQEVPLTGVMAELAADKLRTLPETAGEALLRDALIAATAEVQGVPVLTRNARDFRRLNVPFETY